MRSVKSLCRLAFAGAVVTLLVLNWQAQRDTRRQLDRLTGGLVVLPAEPPPPPAIPPAEPDAGPVAIREPGAVPRELSHVTLLPYVIEAPDVLSVEVVTRNPATDTTTPLPVQPISGQFLVRPDGTVGLGAWGSVEVSGLTLPQAADAVRRKLADSDSLKSLNLIVVVDVLGYNSKRYYVITDGGEGREEVHPFPITGSETVLDAVANVGGLADMSGKQLWVARPSPTAGAGRQILPVDWAGITQHGVTTTNYHLMPGDRLYVTARK